MQSESMRNPVQPRPRHDVINPKDAGEARLMRDRRGDVAMTLKS